MYHPLERLWVNVHKDFKCHAFYLSESGNKYRSQETGNEDIMEDIEGSDVLLIRRVFAQLGM